MRSIVGFLQTAHRSSFPLREAKILGWLLPKARGKHRGELVRCSSLAILLITALASTATLSAQDDAGVASADGATSTAQVVPATIIAINTDGADVSINGSPVGKSPIAPQPLEQGDVIEVQKVGFATLRYEHDGSPSVALFLERLEPLDAPTGASGHFPWLWVGVGAGALAAAVLIVVVAASAGGSSAQGIPIPRIE